MRGTSDEYGKGKKMKNKKKKTFLRIRHQFKEVWLWETLDFGEEVLNGTVGLEKRSIESEPSDDDYEEDLITDDSVTATTTWPAEESSEDYGFVARSGWSFQFTL